MYFPSGEKARALRDFLGTSKGVVTGSTKYCALALLPTPGPQGRGKAWRNKCQQLLHSHCSLCAQHSTQGMEQKQRSPPPTIPNPNTADQEVLILTPVWSERSRTLSTCNTALKLRCRKCYRFGLTRGGVLMGGPCWTGHRYSSLNVLENPNSMNVHTEAKGQSSVWLLRSYLPYFLETGSLTRT